MNYLLLLTLCSLSYADVYLHNPRGSNNRCDRRTNDRRNANRLFDSQNNAAGGYAISCNRPENANNPDDIQCYQMNYYEESILPIRWTSQHACGENNECQYILQYACEDTLGEGVRDGKPQNALGDTCTDTIPEQEDSEMDNPIRYGRHENYHYYQRCESRSRNKGLFTANQRLRGNSAIYTRQNPNGNRYGFECPEERDYYPYWCNTPWVDIAVLTTNTDRCDYYLNNTKCNSNRYECFDSNDDRLSDIEYDQCINREGIWMEYDYWDDMINIPDCNFQCLEAPSSNINRLGIQKNASSHQTFNWILPKVDRDLNNCVLRLRYNISTSETPWILNSSYNGENSPVKNNPIVNVSNVPLRLAVNTAQYGRVFEDRSFTFNILKRPNELDDKKIYNLNVQGKRGNIAQVRNCIEYDFVPNRLNITTDDYIHFQWAGSDYNPHNNAGEGRDGTDRSNLVELRNLKDSYPTELYNSFFTDSYVKRSLASLNQPINNRDMCFSYDELMERKNEQNNINNCALLNRAEPYFNMYPVKANNTGNYNMVCSRNNNFSNRGQKLVINVVQGFVENTTDFEIVSSSSKRTNNYNFQIISTSIILLIIIIGAALMRRKYGSEYFTKSYNNCFRSCKTNV